MKCTWKICLHLADCRSDNYFFWPMFIGMSILRKFLALKRLKIVKLLIKFLCGYNAACRACTLTSNLGFSGEIVVVKCLRKFPRVDTSSVCQNRLWIVNIVWECVKGSKETHNSYCYVYGVFTKSLALS